MVGFSCDCLVMFFFLCWLHGQLLWGWHSGWVDSGFPSCGVLVCIKVNCYDWTLETTTLECRLFATLSPIPRLQHDASILTTIRGQWTNALFEESHFFIPRYLAVRNHLKEGYLLCWNRRDDSWCYTNVVNSNGRSIELLSKYESEFSLFVAWLNKKKWGATSDAIFPSEVNGNPYCFTRHNKSLTQKRPWLQRCMCNTKDL